MSYTNNQVNRIRTISLDASDYETDIFTPLTEYTDIIQRDPVTGDELLDNAGNPLVYEVPKEIKEYNPVIRKLSLDVSANCYLVVNDEYFNPILIRTGGVTTLDYEDIDIRSLKLLKYTPTAKNITVYIMVGI